MLWIAILGGLLIMMGQHDRSEALFYYFRLEDQVPETHLLRLIEKHVSFAFVREQLKGSSSETGRPSIDPTSPFLDRETEQEGFLIIFRRLSLHVTSRSWSCVNVAILLQKTHEWFASSDAITELSLASTNPTAGLFRPSLPVVKHDKAARQTLPTPGKPHPSGPTRQDTG